jgi:allophanate hydrolase
VVPACRTLDCVAIFANTVDDAVSVEEVVTAYDPQESYSRPEANEIDPGIDDLSEVNIGIPADSQLDFFDDEEAAECFDDTIATLERLPGTVSEIDFTPFIETVELLYQGPWVAERLAAVGDFLRTDPGDADPTVKQIIERGEEYSAVETYEAYYQLESYKQTVSGVFDDIDVLVTPTTGTVYRIDEVESESVETNSNLGYYTNFANLLDLSAISVPTTSFDAGPTFGATVFGETFADRLVTSVGKELKAESPWTSQQPHHSL